MNTHRSSTQLGRCVQPLRNIVACRGPQRQATPGWRSRLFSPRVLGCGLGKTRSQVCNSVQVNTAKAMTSACPAFSGEHQRSSR